MSQFFVQGNLDVRIDHMPLMYIGLKEICENYISQSLLIRFLHNTLAERNSEVKLFYLIF